MDSTCVGKFISEKRKALELTQNELAQKLGVTEKEVVKWEEKDVLPKNELVLPLCEALGVSVTELVSGKNLQENEVKEAGEDNTLRYVKTRNHIKFRKIFELVLVAATIISCIASVYVVCRVNATVALKVILILLAVMDFVVGIGVTCVLFKGETDYECPNCKTRFKPEIKDIFLSVGDKLENLCLLSNMYKNNSFLVQYC